MIFYGVAEELTCLAESCLSLAEFLQFSEQLLFFDAQLCWDFDCISDVQAAEGIFLLIDREAFVLQPYFGVVLSARRDLQFHFAIKGIYSSFAAQYGSVEIQFVIAVQIVVQPLEFRIIGNVERDVQIAIWSSISTRAALSAKFDNLSMGNTCGDGNADLLAIDCQVCLWVSWASRRESFSSAW